MKRDGHTKTDLMPYAAARIRAREKTLLNDKDLDSLLACKSYEDCIQYLLDRGWGPTQHNEPGELIALERDRLWKLMEELLKGDQQKILDIFRISNDFHNLKAAIKESYIRKEAAGVYLENGTIPVNKIRECAALGEFGTLPAVMAHAAVRARDVMFRAGDSQLCDVIIDRACLESIRKSALESGNDLLKEYAELQCASADINIVIRASKAGKDEEFLKEALAPCSSLSVQHLMTASRNGLEQIYEYLEQTSYRDCVDAIRQSPAAFDKWCDDRMIRMIRPQKYNAFTASPVIAFLLAKEYEIRSVRLILSGQRNNLDKDKIRERLRESYV